MTPSPRKAPQSLLPPSSASAICKVKNDNANGICTNSHWRFADIAPTAIQNLVINESADTQ